MPSLAEINAESSAHIAEAGARLLEIKNYMDLMAEEELKKISVKEGIFTWKSEDFKACHRALAPDVFLRVFKEASGRVKDFTAEHIEATMALFDNQVGKSISLPYGLNARRVYEGVSIGIFGEEKAGGFCYPVKVPCEIDLREKGMKVVFSLKDLTEGGKLYIKEVKNKEIIINNGVIIKIPESSCIKWFDYDKINNAISLRTMKDGDRITLYSDGGSKKLTDFLADNKVNKSERGSIPLVASGYDIIFAFGHRDSAKYRIDTNTKNILMVEFTKTEAYYGR